MSSRVLFSSVRYNRIDANETLPARFGRLIDAMDIKTAVEGKWTAVKMHVGREIGVTTIHPLYVKILVDK